MSVRKWHHTSSWYNETNFYSIKAFESAKELKDELAKALEADKKAKEPEKKHVLAEVRAVVRVPQAS